MADSRVTTWTEKTELDGQESLAIDDGSNKKLLTKRILKQVDSAADTTPNFGLCEDWNSIDAATNYSKISTPGSTAHPVYIGKNNAVPTGTDLSMGWANDTAYVSGAASVASSVSGYDSINNQIAGINNGFHAFIQYNVDGHSTILGGSYHWIKGGRSTIVGGRGNVVDTASQYGFIGCGDQNTVGGDHSVVVTAETSTASGDYACVLNGRDNTNSGRYGFLSGLTLDCTADYSSSIGSVNNMRGDHSFSSGNAIDTANQFCFGSGKEIDHAYAYTMSFGQDVSALSAAQLVQSGGKENLHGDNQSITFTSVRQSSGTGAALLQASTAGYAIIPPNSVVSGRFYVVGMDEGNGNIASWTIDFVAKKYNDTATLVSSTVTEETDEIVATDPSINISSWAAHRVQCNGVSGRTILWSARCDYVQVKIPFSDTFTVNDTTDIVTTTSNTVMNGERVQLTTTGTLPAGLSLSTTYYVVEGSLYYGNTSFKLSASLGGTAIDITDTGTGTHTLTRV